MPEVVNSWEGEFIISYLSRWIVSEDVINKASVAAINFHPASPDYPGVGCNNFALYENASTYGVTCHHMLGKVDTGNIIAVKRFPVFDSDDVEALLSRTYDFQLALFYDVAEKLLRKEALPVSDEKWSRRPFSRKEFNLLELITPEMSQEEIERRVRATSYGAWQPKIKLGDFIFELKASRK
ncbi:formyltransferase family protein [Pseudomonas donghuensis]|uniref:formyltransferase family protein n=1 Tax=Pseudomonas donghuensis TaxID=1163398 RepID=UPI002160968A|nr:formyltransferase family protein [Pseudomonas donghuensis]UVL23048.1 hypothetical protein LOY30_19730 [Pseudomonas donghuensis]